MKVKFSNGLTITCASMGEARRFLAGASRAVTVERHPKGGHTVRALSIVEIDGKPFKG